MQFTDWKQIPKRQIIKVSHSEMYSWQSYTAITMWLCWKDVLRYLCSLSNKVAVPLWSEYELKWNNEKQIHEMSQLGNKYQNTAPNRRLKNSILLLCRRICWRCLVRKRTAIRCSPSPGGEMSSLVFLPSAWSLENAHTTGGQTTWRNAQPCLVCVCDSHVQLRLELHNGVVVYAWSSAGCATTLKPMYTLVYSSFLNE